jgi:hypothetical protein
VPPLPVPFELGATLGAGTGEVELGGPLVLVSGGGSASTLDPVPGVLPPALFDGLGIVLDPVDGLDPSGLAPGRASTFEPVPGDAPPLVCADAVVEKAAMPSRQATTTRRYSMAILPRNSRHLRCR